MAERGVWRKERGVPGGHAVEGVAEGWWLLRFLHPATATALAAGAGLGGWAGWRLAAGSGWVVAAVCVVAGLTLGGVCGVTLYWLGRALPTLGR